MSRRKQAKPRALKREMEGADGEDDTSASISSEMQNKDSCSNSQPSETGEEQMLTDASPSMTSNQAMDTCDEDIPGGGNDAALHDVKASPVHNDNDDEVKNGREDDEPGGVEEEEELEAEEYRCDVCNDTFHSLTHFMDHRNFECLPDGESSWRRNFSPSNSRNSSPCSLDRKSPLNLSDSPLSPTAAEIPLDQLPFALGANEGHPYACQFCEKAFSRLSFLKKHEQVHSDQMPFRCEFCHRLFKHKRSRDRHVKLHTGDRKYRCAHCHAAFSRSDHLKIHLRTHDNAKPFQCTACNRGFTTAAALTSHSLTHKKGQTNGELCCKCGICNEKFTSESDLQVHILAHELPSSPGKVDKVYQCEKCQEICLGQTALEMHMKETHLSGSGGGRGTGEERSNCPLCKASFTDSGSFFSHLKSHAKIGDGQSASMASSSSLSPNDGGSDDAKHVLVSPSLTPSSAKKRKISSSEERHDCPYCSQGGFVCVDSLEAHIRMSHAGMHVCQFCNAAYPTVNDLEDHIKIIHHASMGLKLACDFCNLEFVQMSDLKNHLMKAHKYLDSRTPSDKNPNVYVCHFCNASYPSIANLEDHIKIIHRTSLGIKFSCEYCPLEFNEVSDLKNHLEKVHKYADIASSKDLDLHFCVHCTSGFPDAFALSEHVHNVHFSTLPLKNGGHESPALVIKVEKHSRPSSASSLTNIKACRESFGSPSGHSDKGSRPSRPSSSTSIVNSNILSCSNGEPMVCEQCNATFLDAKSYNVHMNSHINSSNSKYSCAECSSEFSSEEQLENHVFVHFLSLTTEYGCTSCLKLFTKPDELQKHLMDIHAHHLYRCSLCKEIFDSKVNIQVHFAIKHSNECKLYKCMPCGSVFRSEMEWQLHVKVHHLGMSNPYRCLFCKEAFSTEVELQCHLTTHKKQFPCPLCDEAFHVEYLLDKHMQTKHSPEDPGSSSGTTVKPKHEPQPEIIDYSINGSSSTAVSTSSTPTKSIKVPTSELSPVPRTVTQVTPPQPLVSPVPSNHSHHSTSVTPPLMRKGDLNYRCDICDVKFSEDAALQKHRLHDHSISPEMNLALQKAKAAAVAKQQQQSQQQTQVSPKANQSGSADKFSQLCVYCNKTFKTKSELEKHMKTHVTPSNQKCNICDEIFPSASILAEHKLTHCKVVKGNICVVCKVAMKNEEQFYAHAQQHGFQGTNMQCIVCRQTLASMLELQMHGKHHFQNPASFYTCCVCLGSFDSKENLISKLNSSGRAYYVCKPCYHGELANEFRCSTCNVKFETQGALDTHMANHKKTYQCIKCQQSFASEYEIQVHVATHVMQEGNVHDCKICGTVFDSPAKLQCHLIEHTFEATEIRCYVCNSLFTHASAIQMHVLEHGLGARRYVCTHCPQSFFFAAELQNHIISAHNDGRRLSPATSVAAASAPKMELQCPMCPKTFTSLLALGSHRKTHDKKIPSPMPTCSSSSSSTSGEETLKCSLCPETFPNLGDLQHHFLSSHAADAELLQHKGAFSMVAMDHTPAGSHAPTLSSMVSGTSGMRKSLQCPECRKECSSLAHLQSHSKIHSSGKENRKNIQKVPPPNKPLPCPICGRTFTRKTHLKDHMKVHLQNVQPTSYSCEFCHEHFASTKLLRRHLVSVHHTSTADHICRVCSDIFPQRRHLLAHLQQVHGIVMATKDDGFSDPSLSDEQDKQSGDGGSLDGDGCGDIASLTPSQNDKLGRGMERDGSERSNNRSTPPNGKMESMNGERTEVHLMKKSSSESSPTNKFVGVTVVTNPSEQVTVS